MTSFLALINWHERESDKIPDYKVICGEQKFSHQETWYDRNIILTYASNDSGPNNKVKRIDETKRYLLHIDGLVLNENPTKNNHECGMLTDQVIDALFLSPEKINNLPIRDFHLLIWNKREKKLLVFRDQIGTKPVYYYSNKHWLIISSEVESIRRINSVSANINEDWIADVLVNLSSEGSSTFYKEILLLEPGQYIFSDNQGSRVGSYYRLSPADCSGYTGMEQAREFLTVRLRSAVESKISGFTNVGAELSGGLDSSAVVSLANQFVVSKKIKLHTFSSILTDEDKLHYYPNSDESFYSLELVKYLNIQSAHSVTGERRGILESLKKHLKIMGMPTQQLFTVFADEIYERASSCGVQLLLSGFGGDEGVSYNGTGFFDEMARKGMWDLYLAEMKKRQLLHNRPLGRSYLKYVIEKYVPCGIDLEKILSRKQHIKHLKIKGFGYSSEFGEQMRIREKYISQKGKPVEADVMKMQYYRLTHPYISRRLTYAYQIGLAYGFEYRFPLLDKDLLEFHLGLPSTFKFHNGYRRAIFRESMSEYLPDLIRLRINKHATTIPSAQKRLVYDYDQIKALIHRSKENNKYHYINYDRTNAWLELLKNRQHRSDIPYNPGAFFNSLQILLLQEMERTGEFKTGINC